MNYNKLIICGRVIRKASSAEYVGAGNPKFTFTIVTEVGYGQKQEDMYIDCVAWSKTAESCAQYLEEKQECIIDGQLRQERWTGKDGKTHYKYLCNVNTVQFGHKAYKSNSLSDKPTDHSPASSNLPPQTSGASTPANVSEKAWNDCEDLPF